MSKLTWWLAEILICLDCINLFRLQEKLNKSLIVSVTWVNRMNWINHIKNCFRLQKGTSYYGTLPGYGNSSLLSSEDIFLCSQKVCSQLTVTKDLRPNENCIDFAVSPITGRNNPNFLLSLSAVLIQIMEIWKQFPLKFISTMWKPLKSIFIIMWRFGFKNLLAMESRKVGNLYKYLWKLQ
jgi:hypothetical protein